MSRSTAPFGEPQGRPTYPPPVPPLPCLKPIPLCVLSALFLLLKTSDVSRFHRPCVVVVVVVVVVAVMIMRPLFWFKVCLLVCEGLDVPMRLCVVCRAASRRARL